MKNEAEPRREGVSSQRIRNSSAYRAAMARAAKLLKKPQKLVKLADEGFLKAKKSRPAQLATMLDSLQTLLRLLKAYGNGGYRQLSWSSMVLIVAAIIYFVMPFDLIPDFLLAFGLMDDAAILAWTIATLSDELTRFSLWEKTQEPNHRQTDIEGD